MKIDFVKTEDGLPPHQAFVLVVERGLGGWVSAGMGHYNEINEEFDIDGESLKLNQNRDGSLSWATHWAYVELPE